MSWAVKLESVDYIEDEFDKVADLRAKLNDYCDQILMGKIDAFDATIVTREPDTRAVVTETINMDYNIVDRAYLGRVSGVRALGICEEQFAEVHQAFCDDISLYFNDNRLPDLAEAPVGVVVGRQEFDDDSATAYYPSDIQDRMTDEEKDNWAQQYGETP